MCMFVLCMGTPAACILGNAHSNQSSDMHSNPGAGEWTLVGASGPPQPQARGSLLCEPCVHACGPLVAAQHSSHVAPDALRAALGALPAGAPLACQAGLCVPSSGADLTAACQGRAELTAGLGPGSSGDDMHRELLEVEEEQQQQQGDLIESRGRRKLLMQVRRQPNHCTPPGSSLAALRT